MPTQVLAEIWPKSDRGRSSKPRQKKPTSVSGVVETVIQSAWTQASLKLSGQNPFQGLDRHPFQTSWRDPLIRDPITVAIRDTFKEKLSELLEMWQPRVTRKKRGYRRKADSGEAQTAIAINRANDISPTSIPKGSPQQSEGNKETLVGLPYLTKGRRRLSMSGIKGGRFETLLWKSTIRSTLSRSK